MSEKAVNKAITEIYETIERSLPRKNGQVARAVEKARLLIADVLAKHSNKDGVIPRNKVNAVLNELDAVEVEIYRNLRDELRTVLEDSAEYSTTSLAEAILAIYGANSLLEYAGAPAQLADIPVELAEIIFGLLMESSYKKNRESVVESAFKRTGEDGLQLNARLRNIAKVIREDIAETLRQTIRNGEGTSDILRKAERNFKDLAWRLYTIVETEALYVMRNTLGWFAEKSGMVEALRIVDYPHGDHHKRHKCYIYAHSDEHDLGKGVYPVSTRKIRNPHPRCRSTLHFVMITEFK